MTGDGYENVTLIRQMWAIFLELNSEGLYQSSGKEKESCCLGFPSSTKREIKHFHVVVVHVPFSLPSSSSLLKLPY